VTRLPLNQSTLTSCSLHSPPEPLIRELRGGVGGMVAYRSPPYPDRRSPRAERLCARRSAPPLLPVNGTFPPQGGESMFIQLKTHEYEKNSCMEVKIMTSLGGCIGKLSLTSRKRSQNYVQRNLFEYSNIEIVDVSKDGMRRTVRIRDSGSQRIERGHRRGRPGAHIRRIKAIYR